MKNNDYCKNCVSSIHIEGEHNAIKLVCTDKRSSHQQFGEKVKGGCLVSRYNTCNFFEREAGSDDE